MADIITNGVTIEQLYNGGYATNTVEDNDLVLMIRNGTEVVIRLKDLLQADWSATTGHVGFIKNKPNDLVRTDAIQTLTNKTFKACKVFSYPVQNITNTTAVDMASVMDGDLILSYTTTVNATLTLPEVLDYNNRIIVLCLTLGATGSFTLAPAASDPVGTIVWGDIPAEFQQSKLHVFSLISDGTKWFITQGKTF